VTLEGDQCVVAALGVVAGDVVDSAVEASDDKLVREHERRLQHDYRSKNSPAAATGALAGIVIERDTSSIGTRPTRPLKDEVIYEVHPRGFTMQDPSIAADRRGTYAGAGDKAAYRPIVGQ
jgi:pullulanase/glycogen debranching enzyme